MCSVLSLHLNGQIHFPAGSEFRYLKGSQAQSITTDWSQPEYDDSGWNSGMAPFWYGDGNGGTFLNDMATQYSTIFLRSVFTAGMADKIKEIRIGADYDDGFILWINGIEALRVNAPADAAYNSFAPANHESGSFEYFTLNTNGLALHEGENTIALQGFNISLSSSDFHLNVELDAAPELPPFPDTVSVEYSHTSGYYVSPFYLHLSASDDTSSFLYTLDGSLPGDSPTARIINGSDSVWIDPADTSGRAATPGVVVRTSFVREGYQPAPAMGCTFIFEQELLRQQYPGGTWPAGSINEQVMDYDMDQSITLGPDYADRILEALKDIPVISIITDNDHLFDAGSGIYVNAGGHGYEWERASTVEMFDTDSVAFQVNAGLRIRGGWSRHPTFPKHSFRLFFRSEYGDSKLYYPLFGDEGVNQFDKIDLRTSQNYAWAQGDSRNTMLREVFSRDTQRDMGQPYTRSRYYHLYLNGMYWGLYQTQERSEARYAADYLGGSSEEYDVVKVNTEDWNYKVEATDGNLDLWREVYELTSDGFTETENYYRIEGRRTDGRPDKYGYKLVDIDNLIDYMLTIFYTGNFDAPTSSFGQNKGPNNFYAINNREDPTTGFLFFNHDAEHSLFVKAASPGTGIGEDRVNIGTRDDNLRMEVNSFNVFHPQWLHFKLSDNPEYRMRFTDRAYTCFREGGVFDPEVALDRFGIRMEQIDKAIIAESARWGDAGTWVNSSYTRDDQWVTEVSRIRNQFFSRRNSIVLEQLVAAGLFTTIAAPFIECENLEPGSRDVSISEPIQVTLSNPNPTGLICYTINGTDPRLPGGEVHPLADLAAEPTDLEIEHTTVIRARVYEDGSWSPLNELRCLSSSEDYTGLRVTELHYNPLDSVLGTDTIHGTEFEFIEFKNISQQGINLSGVTIDSSVYYRFPAGEVLLPGHFYVICSSTRNFFERYGMYPSGEYERNLSNGGELLVLMDPQGAVFNWFFYDDDGNWPSQADGEGYSLAIADNQTSAVPGIPEYWKPSHDIGGSPFADDPVTVNHVEPEMFLASCNVYPNPFDDVLTVEAGHAGWTGKIGFRLYSMTGTLVFSAEVNAGEKIVLSGNNLLPGTYIGLMEYEGNTERVKLIKLR